MALKDPVTLGELLFCSYANLAMAHAAVRDGSKSYSRLHYVIRAKLRSGLLKGSMNLGPLSDDERVKMTVEKACCYCGCYEKLSLDHLIPRKRGGSDSGDNLVWCCRSCNSSKSSRDVLKWFALRNRFPPLFLLRRYLKLAVDIAKALDLIDAPLTDPRLADLPFSVAAIPRKYPPPTELELWIAPSSQ